MKQEKAKQYKTINCNKIKKKQENKAKQKKTKQKKQLNKANLKLINKDDIISITKFHLKQAWN